MRETCYYTFPMRKAGLYVEFFLCHIFRHDLSRQQCALPSLVLDGKILYIVISMSYLFEILKFTTKGSYALVVGLFFPNQRSTKVSIETVIEWSPYTLVPFIRDLPAISLSAGSHSAQFPAAFWTDPSFRCSSPDVGHWYRCNNMQGASG